MKRNILIVIYVISIIITLLLVCNFVISRNYIENYNVGNKLYKEKKYDEAIDKYKKALESINIPQKRECSIRINYALAICKTVQIDMSDSESVSNAIRKYESAIDVLTEKGCANKDDDNGHSEKAEQLKKDIQEAINKLKSTEKVEGDSEEEDDNDQKPKEGGTVEQKIQLIKENATKSQRENENKYESYSKMLDNPVDKKW